MKPKIKDMMKVLLKEDQYFKNSMKKENRFILEKMRKLLEI